MCKGDRTAGPSLDTALFSEHGLYFSFVDTSPVPGLFTRKYKRICFVAQLTIQDKEVSPPILTVISEITDRVFHTIAEVR